MSYHELRIDWDSSVNFGHGQKQLVFGTLSKHPNLPVLFQDRHKGLISMTLVILMELVLLNYISAVLEVLFSPY